MKQALVSMDSVLTFLFQKNKIIFYGERGWHTREVLAQETMPSRLIVKPTVTATEQEKSPDAQVTAAKERPAACWSWDCL